MDWAKPIWKYQKYQKKSCYLKNIRNEKKNVWIKHSEHKKKKQQIQKIHQTRWLCKVSFRLAVLVDLPDGD